MKQIKEFNMKGGTCKRGSKLHLRSVLIVNAAQAIVGTCDTAVESDSSSSAPHPLLESRKSDTTQPSTVTSVHPQELSMVPVAQ